MNTITQTINNVDVTLHMEWDSSDGDGWQFCVLAQASSDNDVLREYDGLRTPSPSDSDVRELLLELDEAEWPSETLPSPQIGKVDRDIINSVCAQISAYASASKPMVSASESYFGV